MLEENEDPDLVENHIVLDTSYPFLNPKIETACTERESPIYLSREDIRELGFLRSNPQKYIYQHTLKPKLFLEEVYDRDYSVKDVVVKRVVLFDKPTLPIISRVLYNSVRPNKQDIENIVNNYV